MSFYDSNWQEKTLNNIVKAQNNTKAEEKASANSQNSTNSVTNSAFDALLQSPRFSSANAASSLDRNAKAFSSSSIENNAQGYSSNNATNSIYTNNGANSRVFSSYNSEASSSDSSIDSDSELDDNNDDDLQDADKPIKKQSLNSIYSPGSVMVFLLKGYIDREDNKAAYEALLRHQHEVTELCKQLYLKLVIDDHAGYAFVKSMSDEEPSTQVGQRGPSLLIKRQLSLYCSLVLILLRQRLLEFEVSGQFGRLVLDREDIVSLVMVYLKNINNERLVEDRIQRAIDDLVSLGLLARSRYANTNTKIERIEVKRIINAIVTPEVLAQADEMLANYLAHIRGESLKKRASGAGASEADLAAKEQNSMKSLSAEEAEAIAAARDFSFYNEP